MRAGKVSMQPQLVFLLIGFFSQPPQGLIAQQNQENFGHCVHRLVEDSDLVSEECLRVHSFSKEPFVSVSRFKSNTHTHTQNRLIHLIPYILILHLEPLTYPPF